MNKTKTMLLASAMLLAAPAWAQESERNIWPDKRPAEVVLKKGKMKQEMGDDDILRIQQMPVPTLQKFPVVKSPKGKVVIVCPGGGYQILAVNHEGTEIAQWLNALGYTAYVLRYRVPDNREGALQDVQRAIRYLRLTPQEGYHWGMMRSAWASVADLTVIQLQDVLGLGSQARINTPSTIGGNWVWRCRAGSCSDRLADQLHQEMELYGRL